MGWVDYAVEIEIYEAGGCEMHRAGQVFRYPEEIGSLCPWLLDSVNSMVRVLIFGGRLPWSYAGTAYEKHTDPEGVTMEFVRCPDPTRAGVVAKIIRKKLLAPIDVGWA